MKETAETDKEHTSGPRPTLPNGAGLAAPAGAVVHDRRGRWRTGGGLTDRQEKFVEWITKGFNQSEAARRSGYAHPAVDGWRLMRNPGVIAAIKERTQAGLGALSGVALQTLAKVMEDEAAPAAARVGAARWVLEGIGVGLEARKAEARMGSDEDKPLSQMTAEEIEAFIARTEATAERLRNVTPGAVLDITCSNGTNAESVGVEDQ